MYQAYVLVSQYLTNSDAGSRLSTGSVSQRVFKLQDLHHLDLLQPCIHHCGHVDLQLISFVIMQVEIISGISQRYSKHRMYPQNPQPNRFTIELTAKTNRSPFVHITSFSEYFNDITYTFKR